MTRYVCSSCQNAQEVSEGDPAPECCGAPMSATEEAPAEAPAEEAPAEDAPAAPAEGMAKFKCPSCDNEQEAAEAPECCGAPMQPS